jgi:hypothetical protein
MSEAMDGADESGPAWTDRDRRRILLAAVVSFLVLAVLWFEGRSRGDGGDDGPVGDWPPSDQAASDVPPDLLRVYEEAAVNCPGLPWPVVAGIGKVETDHNRETSTSSAGAQGPMQFLPATWQEFQADGDGDGTADIDDEDDAVYGAVRFLCASGGGDPATLRDAVFAYNRSDDYVDEVLRIAGGYTTGTIDAP